jgi:hypothetical protein
MSLPNAETAKKIILESLLKVQLLNTTGPYTLDSSKAAEMAQGALDALTPEIEAWLASAETAGITKGWLDATGLHPICPDCNSQNIEVIHHDHPEYKCGDCEKTWTDKDEP